MTMGFVRGLKFQTTPSARFEDCFRIPRRSLFAAGETKLSAGDVIRISFKAAADSP
jgi:hypothetical protein